jgi:serine/threonine-protein kinase
MEFVEGRSLRERLTADGPVDPDEAVAIAATVADALAAAHEAGIVHRDVKPANILIEETGAVHLVDFGIASISEPEDGTLTAPRTMIGTIRYVAPERLAGTPATPAGDVWALGAVLYEMVTGRPAIPSTDATDVLAARHGPPDDAATLPGGLGGVVRRAMAVNPADRYPGAAAFRDALLGAELADRTPDQEGPTQVVPLSPLPANASSLVLARAPAARLSPVDRAAAGFFGVVLLVAMVVAIGSIALGLERRGDEVTTAAASPPVVEAAGPTPETTVAPATIGAQRGEGPGNGRGKGHGKGKGD